MSKYIIYSKVWFNQEGNLRPAPALPFKKFTGRSISKLSFVTPTRPLRSGRVNVVRSRFFFLLLCVHCVSASLREPLSRGFPADSKAFSAIARRHQPVADNSRSQLSIYCQLPTLNRLPTLL